MDLFIGRLLALAGVGLLLMAVLEWLQNAEGANLYILIVSGILLAATFLVIIISFFKKHFTGVYNDAWEIPEALTHKDVEGLYPALKINKMGSEEKLSETLHLAMNDTREVVIAKFAGMDEQQVRSLLVFSNQRVFLYRAKSLGLKVAYVTTKRIIDKIPFLLWPIDGLEDAFKRVLGSEGKALTVIMSQATDEQLLTGAVPKWKCRYMYRYDEIKENIQSIRIQNGGWFTRGIDFFLTPVKWTKAFRSAQFTYMYRKHYPEVQAFFHLARPYFQSKVAEIELKENKRATIEL